MIRFQLSEPLSSRFRTPHVCGSMTRNAIRYTQGFASQEPAPLMWSQSSA